ncbi:MAG: hypothetical protein ACRCZG_05715 [Culicoidibacterales bacterium]
MKSKLVLTPERITRKIERAFKAANMGLQRNMVKQITSDKWNWGDGSLRDIVDTGLLRSSQQPPNFVTALKAIHANTVNYAVAVHEGATFKDGRTMPGRPWMTQALKEFDFIAAMKKAYGTNDFNFEVSAS